MTTETTILLVDDHAMLRKGLRMLIEVEEGLTVVGEAGDGQTGIEQVRDLSPDVVVMDISMPNLNGIEATRQILAESPGTKVLALSIHADKRFVESMLEAGASGYLLKESAPEELIKAIDALKDGKGYLSADITDIVLSKLRQGTENKESQPEDWSAGQILATKLHRPNLAAGIVHRQGLIDQLERGIEKRLTLVSAPAGYGKSTLVSDWLSHCEHLNAWLSLDTNDNDLRQFLKYLIAAIRSLFPKACEQIQPLAEAANLPPVSILAGTLISDLEKINQPFVLAMDDIHLVGDKTIQDLLSRLLKHPLKSMHLMLIGRQDPFLPLSSLRAGNAVNEIRMQDLRFSVQETATFLEHALAKTIDFETAEIWTVRTEGWVSGLQLATYALCHCDVSDVSLMDQPWSSQYVKQYLFSEVLDRQSPETRRYLEAISILDRFSAPLCEALWKHFSGVDMVRNGWELITSLCAQNLFIIPLDTENQWFRYHHLFQNLLRNQLEGRCNTQDIAALHSRASEWFAGKGLIDEAIQHAVAAGDYPAAADLVEANRQDLLNRDRWYVLEKWLKFFSEDIVQKYPSLLISMVWVNYHHFYIQAIPALLDTIEALNADGTNIGPFRGEINFFRGYMSFFLNEGARSLEYLDEAMQSVPESYYELHGQIEILHGLAEQSQGQEDVAVHAREEVLAQNPSMQSIRKTRILATLVYIHLMSGDLDRAWLANQQLYSFSSKGNYPYAEVWSVYLRGLIHYYRHELDEAIEQFRQAVDRRHILHTRATFDAMAGLAYAYQAKQQPENAEAALQNLVEFGELIHDPTTSLFSCACRTRLSIMQNDIGSIFGWLKSAPPLQENMVWWLELPSASYCRGLVAEGSPESLEKADRTLRELLDINRQNHNALQMISILTLLAMLGDKLGQTDEPMVLLQQAVSLSAPGRVVQPFVELGAPMARLLKLMMERGYAVDNCKRLLAVFRDEEPPSAVTVSTADTVPATDDDVVNWREILTNREYDILIFLQQRWRDKEIADQLCISPATVKTHLKNIYQKIGATSRRDAVVKAIEIGILRKE
jgi:ATP/maltotriose-dependent transcriptional regulator MalT/ActR/RegA family two-component response regulator